jgi:uncharacterized membrane protein YsdA (DUF1294 family)
MESVIIVYLLIGGLIGFYSSESLKVHKDIGVNTSFMAIAWYPVICLWALLCVISWVSSAIKKLFSIF